MLDCLVLHPGSQEASRDVAWHYARLGALVPRTLFSWREFGAEASTGKFKMVRGMRTTGDGG